MQANSLSGGRAEIRWNAIDGDVLATGGGSEFSKEIRIPEVAPGLYSIILLERDQGGAIAASGRAAFLVTDPTNPESSLPTKAGTSQGQALSTRRSTTNAVSAPLALLGGTGLLLLGLGGGTVLTRRSRT